MRTMIAQTMPATGTAPVGARALEKREKHQDNQAEGIEHPVPPFRAILGQIFLGGRARRDVLGKLRDGQLLRLRHDERKLLGRRGDVGQIQLFVSLLVLHGTVDAVNQFLRTPVNLQNSPFHSPSRAKYFTMSCPSASRWRISTPFAVFWLVSRLWKNQIRRFTLST